jgi:hypothetical protein
MVLPYKGAVMVHRHGGNPGADYRPFCVPPFLPSLDGVRRRRVYAPRLGQSNQSCAQDTIPQGELAGGAGGDVGFVGDEDDGHALRPVRRLRSPQRSRLPGSPPLLYFHRQCPPGHWMISSNWAMSAGRSSVIVSHRMS